MSMMPSQSKSLEFKANNLVCGVDFGYQMVDRWYTINKVPSPFGALTMHFAPPQPPHNFQQYLYMCTMPPVPQRGKYVIFFFDSDELERLAQRNFPFTIALKNITGDMLKTLTDCEIARFKVGKGDVTFYVYAVKWRGRAFERIHELYDLLDRLPSLTYFEDCFRYTPPPSQNSHRKGLSRMIVSREHKSSSGIRASKQDLVQEQRPSREEESTKLLRISPKSRALKWQT